MQIAVIPGDGIGPQVTAEARTVLSAAASIFGRRVEIEELPWSAGHFLGTGITVPPDGYTYLREFNAVLLGALGDPRVPDHRHARDILLGTRRELDPVHGSAPTIAGRNLANPVGAILSVALLLRHIGWDREADAVETAVRRTVVEWQVTPDIGGTLGTREACAAVMRNLHTA